MAFGSYNGIKNIKAFSGYVVSLFAQRVEEFSYRTYVTESLKLQAQGAGLAATWHELVRPKKRVETDPDEVINDLLERGCFEIEPSRLNGQD